MDAYVLPLLPENQLGVFIIPSSLMIWITAVVVVCLAIEVFILSLKPKKKIYLLFINSFLSMKNYLSLSWYSFAYQQVMPNNNKCRQFRMIRR